MANHKIILGDCIEKMVGLKYESVDMIIADPPFNIGKRYNSYKDRKKTNDYFDWCKEWIIQCTRVLKPGGSLYLFNYPERNAYLMPILDKFLTFKRWMVWHYHSNTGMSPTNFTRSHTSILFYIKGKKPKTFNKNDIAEPYKNPTDRRVSKLIAEGSKGRTPYDVFLFNVVKNVSKDKANHPCQLPIPLLSILVKASSNEEDIVLDPFGGSFSTAITCKQLGRKSITIELDERYCKEGTERLKRTSKLSIDPETNSS